MTRNSGLRGSFCAAGLITCLLVGVGSAPGAELPVCWNDGGPTHNWSDADNWNPPLAGGPRNVGTLEFLISIGCAGDPNNCPEQTFNPIYFDNVAGPVEITDFFLCNDSKLVLNPGTDLTVLRTTEIDGIIDGQGGIFTACGDSVSFSGDRARVEASDGSIITICASTYSSTGIWNSWDADPHSYGDQTGTWYPDLIKATGIGSLVDLSSVVSIDAGFASGGNDHNYQQISALNGGVVDLSGVLTITGPASERDDIRFIVDPNTADPNQTNISLSNLQRITTSYCDPNSNSEGHSKQTRFSIRGGSTQLLPALQQVRQVEFIAMDGSAITAPSLAQIANSTFILTDGSRFTDGDGAATFASTGIWNSWDADPHSYGDQTGTWYPDLIKATGIGSLVDLSSVVSIDAGFASGGNDHNYQQISALNGGVVDLSGVLTITGPASGRDDIRFIVDPNGGDPLETRIDLSALTMITNAGSGDVRLTVSGGNSILEMSSLVSVTDLDPGEAFVNVDNGGHILIGDVSIDNSPTTIEIGADSLLSLASLQACSSVSISLNAQSARLEVDDYLRLGDDITIAAPTGGTVSLGGDFSYTHEDAADVALALSHIECVGESQLLEVGGPDYDIWVPLIPDDGQGGRGFGFKQLTVGGSGQASTVELVDRHDNMMAGVADALYLFGVQDPNNPSADIEGLQILDGSTLVIGDLNVYALLDMDASGNLDGVLEYINLHSLFGAGETIIPFDHNGNNGYISLTPTYCQADLVEDGQVNLQDLQMLLAHYGTTCFAEPYEGDLNGDGDVDLGDLQTLLSLYGSACP